MLKGSVLLSGEGRIVAFTGHERLRQLFIANDFFIELVHLNDRIAILTFFDLLRQRGSSAPVSFRLQHHGGVVDNCRLAAAAIKQGGGLEIQVHIQAHGSASLQPPRRQTAGKHAGIPPLAAVAHEMCTPLNAIIGFSDFLLHETRPRLEHESQREYVSLIKKSGEHLLAMVTHMLGQEEPAAAVEEADQDIAGIIQDCAAMMASLLCQRHVVFNTAKAGACHVVASNTEVRQIVINLLSNAIKYTGHNGRITLQTSLETGNHVALSVADNGMGISRRQRARIGVPYCRAANALKSHVAGTGLGLALVYKIAKTYGGKVRIKSRYGKGTVVSVFLPCANHVDGQGQAGRADHFPHLVHASWTANNTGMKDHDTDNGKKEEEEKEIRKSA